MNNNKISFTYDTAGYTVCSLWYDGKEFIGKTFCYPEDIDFWSEKTGCFIAECKANIKKLKYIKAKLAKEIEILIKTENELKCCKYYNPEHFESKRLQKIIDKKRIDLEELKNCIKEEEEYLHKYIQDKDHFYKKIRSKKGQTK
ncbi:MAG: hypothetical protein ACI4VL_03535 [Bacilli bacterium]